MSTSDDRQATDYLDLMLAAYQMGRADAHAELDRVIGQNSAAHKERRWGPGGREHFGDPKPGDFQGGPVAWEREQKEAGE